MSKRTPPIPPAGRSRKGPQQQPQAENATAENAHVGETDKRLRNLEQQGHQANITQNTRNQGYQQDR